jgi:hypothetical protein
MLYIKHVFFNKNLISIEKDFNQNHQGLTTTTPEPFTWETRTTTTTSTTTSSYCQKQLANLDETEAELYIILKDNSKKSIQPEELAEGKYFEFSKKKSLKFTNLN